MPDASSFNRALRQFAVLLAIAAVIFLTSAVAAPLSVSVGGTARVVYQDRYALLIGASEYETGWARLRSVDTELDLLEATLTQQGFSVTRLRNPTSANLYTTMREFVVAHADPNAAVMVVFSGHGWTDPQTHRGYIVPVNAPDPATNRAAFLASAVSMLQVQALGNESEAMHTLFVFDSCFSGTVFTSRSSAPPPPTDRVISVAAYEQMRRHSVRAITSGDENQRVPEQSRFMPLFITGIRGQDGADMNVDGYVSFTELQLWFRDTINITPQTPQFGSLLDAPGGDFLFRPMGAAASPNPSPVERADRADTLREQSRFSEAAQLYQDAAEVGDAPAMLELGRLYENGRGVPRDFARAAALYESASGRGNARAFAELARMHDWGRTNRRDSDEIIRLLRRSAELGNATAMRYLGEVYFLGQVDPVPEQPNPNRPTARLVPGNNSEALRWFVQSSSNGNAYATFWLGLLHEMGQGVAMDRAAAVGYYRTAARAGVEAAQARLRELGEEW